MSPHLMMSCLTEHCKSDTLKTLFKSLKLLTAHMDVDFSEVSQFIKCTRSVGRFMITTVRKTSTSLVVVPILLKKKRGNKEYKKAMKVITICATRRGWSSADVWSVQAAYSPQSCQRTRCGLGENSRSSPLHSLCWQPALRCLRGKDCRLLWGQKLRGKCLCVWLWKFLFWFCFFVRGHRVQILANLYQCPTNWLSTDSLPGTLHNGISARTVWLGISMLWRGRWMRSPVWSVLSQWNWK